MSKSLHTFVIPAYKESVYLENCIISVLDQEYKSDVLITTSTPNKHISDLAKKYNIEVIENKSKEKGIGIDFNYAIEVAKTPLVTVAHQDDLYEHDYSKKVVDKYLENKDAIIISTNYSELKDSGLEKNNINLVIKKILLFPLKINNSTKFFKRSALRFGNAICCPSVTFVKDNVEMPVFTNHFSCNVDWEAWERLSLLKGRFINIPSHLMQHRIHNESTTTEIIGDNKRTVEDYEMYLKFWPKWFAKIINRVYKNAEKNNK